MVLEINIRAYRYTHDYKIFTIYTKYTIYTQYCIYTIYTIYYTQSVFVTVEEEIVFLILVITGDINYDRLHAFMDIVRSPVFLLEVP